MDTAPTKLPPRLMLPDAPALVAGAQHAVWLSPDGEVERLGTKEARARLGMEPPLVCHAPATFRRLGVERLPAYDLLELFAFVHPARFCVPTPRGLAAALGIDAPRGPEGEALVLFSAARRLLEDMAAPGREERSDPVAIAWVMGTAGAQQGYGWPWARFVLSALGAPAGPAGASAAQAARALQVWRRLPEWSEHAPEPPPGQVPVEPSEARTRLGEMLAAAVPGKAVEPRPQQADYASAVTHAFTPRNQQGAPNLVLAEAGTGVGKTLGYLAAASLWAEKNKAPVWISTYTRNLQHQIDGELDRLHPEPAVKARRVVVRKGRENYLCLLNLEEAVNAMPAQPAYAVPLGLMARWAAATRDGDVQGGDFPGWLADIAGRVRTLGLADRRGECIYSACPHYDRCFIERSVRLARRAEIVIANHALVMVQAALGGGDDAWLPTRYVFDEGHHVFEAADNAFAGHLTAVEGSDLRRWLIGPEGGARSRARGLKRRVEDLLQGDEDGLELIDEILRAARALPGEGWSMRVNDGAPSGPGEAFLLMVRRMVLTRAPHQDSGYSLECDTAHPIEGLLDAAGELEVALARLQKPIEALVKRLRQRLDDEAAELDTDTRGRIEAVCRSLDRRGTLPLGAWQRMLASLEEGTPAGFVDWFGLERHDGRDLDVGLYRHHVDPTQPFAATVGAQAHGMVVTSATLTDGTGDLETDWLAAMTRTGALHMPTRAMRASVPSPFDYGAHTRVMVVTDVRKDDLDQVSAAYRELFLAAGGGGLGLFTAIGRLRAVHKRIAGRLEDAGLPLYAQHVDGLDVGTLVDIFRGEEHACLLGTDAVRDGVDVPGRSLRLIVFDRVPWPRPDILHRARREAFGGRRWDDMLTRLRLRQAFGRLVRRADDTGVFVLLDPMMPSRLEGAFPPDVEIRRVGLAEAVQATRAFLSQGDGTL
ncbi:ATP-dependent DNA helicase [Arenibaculum pallidiluteum]|uniref:ATP-dependent DNA helicase n=1 Tax=Arenibaculum pallidiluteum TaxID=2812559 RepID=UPI001A97D2B9|nr:ATP-dependent DNA helicase [Arenibaculum pallidiluteum]